MTLRSLCTCLLLLLGMFRCPGSGGPDTRPLVLVTVGAEGEEPYREQFETWASRWEAAAKKGEARFLRLGPQGSESNSVLHQLKQMLTTRESAGSQDLWLVFIGHGTFDGKEAKFNLGGDDLSAADLATWLAPMTRRVAVLMCHSSSGPFLSVLSRTNRVVATATRSGSEQNFARYGDYLSTAIGSLDADLDKDGQVSLLEAHLTASRMATDFYLADGRLATEHSLIDDTGDALGTPADWFKGIRATRKAKEGAEIDGLRAQQWCLVPNEAERRLPPEARRARDELELRIAQLRESKESMPEADYYRALEPLMLELGRIYQQHSKP